MKKKRVTPPGSKKTRKRRRIPGFKGGDPVAIGRLGGLKKAVNQKEGEKTGL